MADLFEIGIKVDMKPLQSANRELDRLESALTSVTGATARTSRSTQQNTNANQANTTSKKQNTTATNQMAQANQHASRKINEVSMGIQQAGYQVGDFFVQIQSGTNAFVAFGQQATQLVGILPMFASKLGMSVGSLIAISSGLGIAIPLVTMIGAAFMRTQSAAEDTSSAIDRLEQSLSEYKDMAEIAEASTTNLYEEFGIFGESVREAAKEIRQLKAQELEKEIDAIANSIEGINVANISGVIPSFINRDIRDWLRLNEGIRKNNESVAIFVNALKGLESAKGVVNQIAAAERLRETFKDVVGEAQTGEQKEFLNNLNQLIISLSDYGKAQQGAYEDVLGSAEGLAAAEQVLNDQFEQSLNERNEAAKKIEEERLERAKKAADAERMLGEQLQASMRQQSLEKYEAEQKAIAETEEYIKAMEVVFNEAQRRMRDEEIAATEASLDRLFRARTVSYRIRFAGEADVMGQTVAPSGGRMDPGMTRQELLDLGVPEANLENFVLKADPSTGGGGGLSQADKLKSASQAVDQLRASYDEQFATLLKVEDAQRKVNELIALNPELTNEANKVLNDYIASLEQADNTMANFTNNAAQQMADAFMSIVDGSKSASDAFRDMARSILKQAFELMVINPLINSIFGGVGGFTPRPTLLANGAAFSNGNVVPFADGGVVSSPTMFPMRGNQTGLMGEAGPEAIMPLKRTKGGKLGVVAEGGGNVTIHQSFNFSANGDDSVKRIIAEEAPKIATLTQKQIMDQRRRGGQMKATFG